MKTKKLHLTFGITLFQFPEEYDVYWGRKIVGYIKLNKETFKVWYPDCEGKIIYKRKGNFTCEEEQIKFLQKAYLKIYEILKQDNALLELGSFKIENHCFNDFEKCIKILKEE